MIHIILNIDLYEKKNWFNDFYLISKSISRESFSNQKEILKQMYMI